MGHGGSLLAHLLRSTDIALGGQTAISEPRPPTLTVRRGEAQAGHTASARRSSRSRARLVAARRPTGWSSDRQVLGVRYRNSGMASGDSTCALAGSSGVLRLDELARWPFGNDERRRTIRAQTPGSVCGSALAPPRPRLTTPPATNGCKEPDSGSEWEAVTDACLRRPTEAALGPASGIRYICTRRRVRAAAQWGLDHRRCRHKADPKAHPSRRRLSQLARSASRVTVLTVADPAFWCLCRAWLPTNGVVLPRLAPGSQV